MTKKECFFIALALLIAGIALAVLLLVAATMVFLIVIFSVALIKTDPCYFIAAIGLVVLAELIKLYAVIDDDAHKEYERRIFERKVRQHG